MRDIEGDEVGLRETMKERDRKKGVFVCVCVSVSLIILLVRVSPNCSV